MRSGRPSPCYSKRGPQTSSSTAGPSQLQSHSALTPGPQVVRVHIAFDKHSPSQSQHNELKRKRLLRVSTDVHLV